MKEQIDLRGLNFEEGYIAVLDKPLRWTSTDVVRKIKFTLRRTRSGGFTLERAFELEEFLKKLQELETK